MSNKNFFTEKIAQWTTENTMWLRTTEKTGDNKRSFESSRQFLHLFVSVQIQLSSRRVSVLLKRKKKQTKSQTQKTQTHALSIINPEQIWGFPPKLQMSAHSLLA